MHNQHEKEHLPGGLSSLVGMGTGRAAADRPLDGSSIGHRSPESTRAN